MLERSELPPHVATVLAYEHKYRLVYVTRVWRSHGGDRIVTGYDPDAEGWRSFRADRISKIRLIEDGRLYFGNPTQDES